jgi:peptidoglycan/LPS O-acetylase OafA/YrhL
MKPTPQYMRQLDGLRAFAVLAVVLGHTLPESSALNKLGVDFLGVRLFFVLSGFLITGILLKVRLETDRAGFAKIGVLKRFYIRRFLRIFPAYYFVLFLFALLGLRPLLDTFFWHLFYLSNYYLAIHGQWLDSISHFWSLAVEEQFYLFWPVIVLFIPIRRLLPTTAILILLSPLLRFVLAILFHNGITAKSTGFACMDLLGLGALLAYFWTLRGPQNPETRKFVRMSVILGLGLLIGSFVLKGVDYYWSLRVATLDFSVALLFTWLVWRAALGTTGISQKVLEWKPLVYIGKISYGIYLYHNFMVWSFSKFFNVPDFGFRRFVFVTVTSVLVASCSWYALERPFNRMKDRFPYLPVKNT